MGNLKRFTGFRFPPFLIGCMGHFHLLQRPRFSSIHTFEVRKPLRSRACFDVALAGLIVALGGLRTT